MTYKKSSDSLMQTGAIGLFVSLCLLLLFGINENSGYLYFIVWGFVPLSVMIIIISLYFKLTKDKKEIIVDERTAKLISKADVVSYDITFYMTGLLVVLRLFNILQISADYILLMAILLMTIGRTFVRFYYKNKKDLRGD
jgi:hypothetical protein